MSDEAHEATPDHELERQIMSYNEAKNEREWWAMHEIERLRDALRNVVAYADLPQVEQNWDLWELTTQHARAALGEGKE